MDNNCPAGCRCDECVALAKSYIGSILKALADFYTMEDQKRKDRIATQELRRFNACPIIYPEGVSGTGL